MISEVDKLFLVFKFLKGDLTRAIFLEHTRPTPPDESSCPIPKKEPHTNQCNMQMAQSRPWDRILQANVLH